jgi:hypothetical protein
LVILRRNARLFCAATIAMTVERIFSAKPYARLSPAGSFPVREVSWFTADERAADGGMERKIKKGQIRRWGREFTLGIQGAASR